MKYRGIGRFGVLFLALTLLFNTAHTATAASAWADATSTIPEGAKVIAEQSGNSVLSLWHYSGGYWGLSDTDQLRIYDNELKGDLSDLAERMGRKATFSFSILAAVTAAENEGKKIGVCISHDPSYNYFSSLPKAKVEGGKLTIEAYPVFHLLQMRETSYDDFVDGLNNRIPFVDPKYGWNAYSIYSTSGKHLGALYGSFDPNNPGVLPSPGSNLLHPSLIKDSSGALIGGQKFTIGGTEYDSSSLKVGHGTFSNAGAVALYFNYILNIIYYEIESDEADVAVTRIEKTSYPATSLVTADVTVQNLGNEAIVTPVAFSIPGLTEQSKDIALEAGQSAVLHFTFSTPETGPITMTAEANQSRAFKESTYDNNILSVIAQIIPAPEESASCSDTIRWTETDSHRVRERYWDSYSQRYVSYWYDCHHTFTYEAKLTTTHTISPKTLKSGYGIAVNVTNTVSTRMVRNRGCPDWGDDRENTLVPRPPDKAQVKMGWTVTNRLGTQPSTVDLNLLNRTSTQSRFECRPNPISEIRAKQIYTDVALAGTKERPKTHQLILSITGGGVNGIPFCTEIRDRITINGNMYEDDTTGAN